MNTVKKETLNVMYQEGEICLGEAEGRTYFFDGERSFLLTGHPYEPCLYLKPSGGARMAIHNAFRVEELCGAAMEGGTIRMITGNEYDISGLCRLLLKAVNLGRADMDIGYVEGHVFLDHLKQQGAVTQETAIDLAAAGIRNFKVMNPFLHSKTVRRTADGRFYLCETKERIRAGGDLLQEICERA